MDVTSFCHLLLGTDQLIVKQVVIEKDRISLEVESCADQAACPKCEVVAG